MSRVGKAFSSELSDLRTNRNYLLLLVFFTIELGLFIAISTFIIKIVMTFDS